MLGDAIVANDILVVRLLSRVEWLLARERKVVTQRQYLMDVIHSPHEVIHILETDLFVARLNFESDVVTDSSFSRP